MRRRVLKAVLGLGGLALALGLGIGMTDLDHDRAIDGQPSNILSLSLPAFAQPPNTNEFPHNEVGICAYAGMGSAIDLSSADVVFSGIEASEADYTVGIVALPNLPEDMWPHVYIGSDGWIMSYYPKSEPASRIVQWNGYQQGKITTTTLYDALVQVCHSLRMDTAVLDSALNYCHFQYPLASRLLIAVDTATGKDTFSYTIPSGLPLYEAALSLYAANLGTYDDMYVEIDSTRFYSVVGGTHHKCYDIDYQLTSPSVEHQVSLYCESKWVGAAVVFIHQ